MDDIGKKLGFFALSRFQHYTHERDLLRDAIPDTPTPDGALLALAAHADMLAEHLPEPCPKLDEIRLELCGHLTE